MSRQVCARGRALPYTPLTSRAWECACTYESRWILCVAMPSEEGGGSHMAACVRAPVCLRVNINDMCLNVSVCSPACG